MNKIDENKYKVLIHKLSLKHKLPDNIIKELVESPYEFSALKIKELNLEELSNQDDYKKIKSNFMYTVFGRLFINPVAFKQKIKRKNNKLNK